jgi:hypothetical protein
MLFEILVMAEVLICLLLLASVLQALSELPPAPELYLGQRAWTAAHFSMAEARALGPLFKHLVRASRQGLLIAHRMQDHIRDRRERRSSGPLRPLASLWQRRRSQRTDEFVELAHLVEQLEQMGAAIARYRGGTGRLMEVQVPLRCVQQAGAHTRASVPPRAVG